jgi:hypothetical protein
MREAMMDATDIRNRVMAARAAQGLKIRILTPEGASPLYPKDATTKAAWIAAALRKGYQILEA